MDANVLISELNFKAVRSSGPGGQNVNKVSSKIVLSFDLEKSNGLSPEEKLLLETKLASRLNSEKMLVINCDEDRSQLKNKDIVTKRFLDLIEKSLVVPKTRKATKVPKSVVEKRIAHKKTVSVLKQTRKRPNLNNLNQGE